MKRNRVALSIGISDKHTVFEERSLKTSLEKQLEREMYDYRCETMLSHKKC